MKKRDNWKRHRKTHGKKTNAQPPKELKWSPQKKKEGGRSNAEARSREFQVTVESERGGKGKMAKGNGKKRGLWERTCTQ